MAIPLRYVSPFPKIVSAVVWSVQCRNIYPNRSRRAQPNERDSSEPDQIILIEEVTIAQRARMKSVSAFPARRNERVNINPASPFLLIITVHILSFLLFACDLRQSTKSNAGVAGDAVLPL